MSTPSGSVRVYVPGTTTLLRELLAAREITASADAPVTAFAVTPGLREWYTDDDEEALEYAALSEAARASLRLLDADPDAARLRVVVAVDMPASAVETRDDLDRAVVQVTDALPFARVASVHVDDIDATDTVARGAESIIAADLGEPSAQDAVDDVEGYELSWFASQEIETLLDAL